VYDFPIFCIDKFYENPDRVREFALNCEYKSEVKGNEKYSGYRTECISTIDIIFYNKFCEKLLSIFYQNLLKTDYRILTYFCIHPLRNTEIKSSENRGRIHTDHKSLIGGVIYLNPNPYINSGTSIYKLLKQDEHVPGAEIIIQKITTSRYIETASFKNVYNRLVGFDGKIIHGISNTYMPNDMRLSQVFFLNYLNDSKPPPLQRVNKM